MRVSIQFDYSLLCKTVLTEQLDHLGVAYSFKSSSEIEFKSNLTPLQKTELQKAFSRYGITILEDTQNILVQDIKNTITELLNDFDKTKKYNVSTYLSEKLNYSYSHLSTVFSETTHSSIENFVILKKIDVAKQLIIKENLTLTEIAFQLNYSSVAHLSAQFKKTTGLTPSSFRHIIEKRKEKELMSQP